MARSSFHRGRVAAGGRAARIIRRAQWREQCPWRLDEKGMLTRRNYHGFAVLAGYRHPLFRCSQEAK